MSIVAPPKPQEFNPTAYGARGAIPTGALQGSSTHHRLLLCEVTTVAEKEVKIEFVVGGEKVTGYVTPITEKLSREVPFCILIPAGATWELKASTGIKEVFGNLINLN